MKKPLSAIGLVVGLVLFAMSGTVARAEIAPYYGAPLCAEHDPLAYHGLWNYELGCHFNHTHGDDPHALDAEFGSDLWAIAGGDISYPWQTPSENTNKHEGYYWIVRENLACPTSPLPGCITDFRALVHQMADGHDAPVRYHSFVLEARVCAAACGFIRVGGWQDTGDLEVNGTIVINEPNSFNRIKQHRSNSPNAVWYPSSQIYEQGLQGFARVSLTIYDQWDYTSASAPGNFTDYVCYPAPACRANGTSMTPHLVVVDVPALYESDVDPDGNGVADYAGYLNRYGALVTGCAETGLDCVPFVLSNVRVDIGYSINATAGARDHDVYFCGTTLCTATTPGARPSGWQEPHH